MDEIINKRALKKKIFEVSEGVFAYSVDLLLWLIAYTGGLLPPQPSYQAPGRAAFAADRFLEEFNYQTLKNALLAARKKGLVKKGGRGKKALPQITEEGKRRLESILPHYEKERTWDGRIYLVTYDIAERRRFDRDLLREYLERLGAGQLQESVWIIPYNPKETLREFIKERNLTGSIIISDIGEDGSIGEEDLKDLIVRVYKLVDLNKRYEEFLEEFENQKIPGVSLLFKYFSILRDDPQLPFELLPAWWKGDKAYLLIKDCFKHQSI